MGMNPDRSCPGSLTQTTQFADLSSMSVLYRIRTEDRAEMIKPEGPKTRRRMMGVLIVSSIVFVICVTLLMLPQPKPTGELTADAGDIEAFVIRTALRRPSHRAGPSGGVLGPWWIYAQGSSATGGLTGLCLEDFDTHITAQSAIIEVDAANNTLSLRLSEGIIVTLPSEDVEGQLNRFNDLLLGPIPMSIDITTLDQSGSPSG